MKKGREGKKRSEAEGKGSFFNSGMDVKGGRCGEKILK